MIDNVNSYSNYNFTKNLRAFNPTLKSENVTLKNSDNTSVINDMNKSLEILKKMYDELTKDIPILKGSIQEQILNGELSKADIEALNEWKDENKAFMQWVNNDFEKEYIKIYHTSMSIEEFKERYLELQAKQEQYIKDFTEQATIKETHKTQENNEENLGKTFIPIQGESKNKETYQGKDTNEFLKKLLENHFDTKKQLELLFGTKFDDDKSNNELKNIDIKA